MAGFEIVEVVVGLDAAGFSNDAVGEGAQLGKLFTVDQARDHQIPVAPIILDLAVGQHAKS